MTMQGIFRGRIAECREKKSLDGTKTYPTVSISVGKPDAGMLVCGVPASANGLYEKCVKNEDQLISAVVNVRTFEGRTFFDLVSCDVLLTPPAVAGK
jgi:hypothetical protein